MRRGLLLSALMIALALVAAVVLIWVTRSPETVWEITRPDGTTEKVRFHAESCEVVGWKEDLKIGFVVSVTQEYKGEAGFNWSREELRRLDELNTDFGIQSRSLCNDWQQGVYKGREALYDCRKANMARALSRLRELRHVLETVKSVDDAAVKRGTVKALTDDYFEASGDRFTGECDRRLRLGKNKLEFSEPRPIDTFLVVNVGFFRLTWWIEDFPKIGFYSAQLAGSTIAPGEKVLVEVVRTLRRIEPGEYSLVVVADNRERESVQMIVREESAYRELQREFRIASRTKPPSSAATWVVEKHAPDAGGGTKWFLSGQLLFGGGSYKAALEAYNRAEDISPQGGNNPYFLYHLGLSQYKAGEGQAAVDTFRALGRFSTHKAVASANIASILISQKEGEQLCLKKEEGTVCYYDPKMSAEEAGNILKGIDQKQLESEKPGAIRDLAPVYGVDTAREVRRLISG